MTTGKSDPLAPSPPVYNGFASEQQNPQPAFFAESQQIDPVIISGVTDVGALKTHNIDPVQIEKSPTLSMQGCRIKDRFDRKALIAYEWDRSRLALDVDGINMDSDSDRGFRLEYKIRLQPEKPKKMRCRYASKWQGLIGSGYNELVVRENDTVWSEIREIRRDVKERLDRVF